MLDFTSPYCLINQGSSTFYYTGEIRADDKLSDLPAASHLPVVTMVPFSQVRERGMVWLGPELPLVSLVSSSVLNVSQNDLELMLQGGTALEVRGDVKFTPTDEEFSRIVKQVVENEICKGEGSNFLISRKGRVHIEFFDAEAANLIFARLARQELASYMTFCFFDGEKYFIGSSPERHITVINETVTMNPICGTLPKARLGSRSDLIEFLSDPKEVNELFQVVDEELKMMSRICADGGRISGPYLKELGSVIHTEYELEGTSGIAPLDAFRESMFAATMLGSPLTNAARIISKYEVEPRGYYSSALMIRRLDENGKELLDSAITIRTMEVSADGDAVLQAGASIVRDSQPHLETAEVRAKTDGILRAISQSEPMAAILPLYQDDFVNAVLRSRNTHLSRFWTRGQDHARTTSVTPIRRILIIDNEDDFTSMIKHLLSHLGVPADVISYADVTDQHLTADLVLMGPGPGDPNNLADPKIKKVHALTSQLLEAERPFAAVCLGHQVVAKQLGFNVEAIDPPMQGIQDTIDFFGRSEAVGFYNTYFAKASDAAPAVEVAADDEGRIMAIRSPHFFTLQFHVESVLTTNSLGIMEEVLQWLTDSLE